MQQSCTSKDAHVQSVTESSPEAKTKKEQIHEFGLPSELSFHAIGPAALSEQAVSLRSSQPTWNPSAWVSLLFNMHLSKEELHFSCFPDHYRIQTAANTPKRHILNLKLSTGRSPIPPPNILLLYFNRHVKKTKFSFNKTTKTAYLPYCTYL